VEFGGEAEEHVAQLSDKGYGYADIENKVEATPDTIYRVGSVTKQFTAVAILQLHDAGKLKLADPITTHLTDYSAPPKPITIENLLQHTSGVPDFTRQPSHRPNAYKERDPAGPPPITVF
jgi:CubicO group peptidase (beta-lactamase class C family)